MDSDRLRLREMVDTVWFWYGERARKAQRKNYFDHRGADLLVESTKAETLTWIALHLNQVGLCYFFDTTKKAYNSLGKMVRTVGQWITEYGASVFS